VQRALACADVCCTARARYLGCGSQMSLPDTGALSSAFASFGLILRSVDEAALRDAVCEYVAAAKQVGMRPEEVIVAIRAAADASRPGVNPVVMQRVVEWCLEKYFETPGASAPDSQTP
jgi:hypothetical protein